MATSSKEMTWQSQQALTYRTLDKMRQAHQQTDLIIVCDSKEFHVHRLHLSSSTRFFRAMFESKMKESNTGKVNLKSISADAMEIILEFLYNGHVPDIPEEKKELLYNLLHATHMLQVEPLFEYYMEVMYNSISHSKFLEVIEVAELYNSKEVLAQVYSFLADNFIRTSLQQEFNELRLSHLKNILSQAEMSNSCADNAVKGILRWVKFNECESSGALEDLMALVRLDTLSTEYLNVLLSEDDLTRNCQVVFNSLVPLGIGRLNKPRQESKMLSFGVINKEGTSESFMTDFSLDTMTWGKSVHMPFSIELGMAVAGVANDVFFAGGGGGSADYDPSACVRKYSYTDNTVTFHSLLGTAVNQASATVLNNHLYVVGGRGKSGGKQNVLKRVQRINLANGKYTLLASTHEVHNVPNVLPSQHYLYVVGSGSGKNVCVEQYNCYLDSWTVVTRLPGDIKWCRATLTQNKLFVTRKWEEKRFYIFDIENKLWTIRNFVGGPSTSNGLWSVNGNQYILVKEVKTNTLHAYDSQQEKWGKKVIKSNHPWFWTLTVIV